MQASAERNRGKFITYIFFTVLDTSNSYLTFTTLICAFLKNLFT